MPAKNLSHLAHLIADESHAAIFQSLRQYRQALLKEIAQASAAPEQEAAYLLRVRGGLTGWRDSDKEAFDSALETHYEKRLLYTHPSAEIERLRAELEEWAPSMQRLGDENQELREKLVEAQALLRGLRTWLNGSNYDGVEGYNFAQKIDAFLSATAQPAEENSRTCDIDAMITMLESGEWAEHAGNTDLGRRLEAAITDLINTGHYAHDLARMLDTAHRFIESTEAFGISAASGILECKDIQWDVDESKSLIRALRAQPAEVKS